MPMPGNPDPNYVPMSGANAATLFIQSAPASAPGPAPTPASQLATLVPGSQYAPAPIPASQPLPQPQFPQVNFQVKPLPPPMAIPAAQPPPYHTSQTGITRTGRPVDPWHRSLRIMMFVWGLLLLAVFAAPVQTRPDLTFLWKMLGDAPLSSLLGLMLFAVIGLASLVISALPMPSAIRGLIAALIGLTGVVVPILLTKVPPWTELTAMIGMLLLVPGLVIRSEYRDSLVARLMVTFGAIGLLAPALIPQDGTIPLVSVFKTLIDQPGLGKVMPALVLGQIMVIVMSLLAWLPAPITGGAMLWAWLVILWALVAEVATLLLTAHPIDLVVSQPSSFLSNWIVGGGPGIGAAYLVLVGYGLATLIGKQLE
jgi:hypothetical protein